jgi:hypothetical protein
MGIAGLTLGLILLGGGMAVTGAHRAAAASPTYGDAVAQGMGAGLDAGMPFRLAVAQIQPQSQDPACASQPPDAAENPNDADSAQDQSTANDTDNIQDQSTANDGTENPSDTDTLQCGDQTGTDGTAHGSVILLSAKVGTRAVDAGTQQEDTGGASESENASETENAAGNDQAVDGVTLDQQGQHEGDNAG